MLTFLGLVIIAGVIVLAVVVLVVALTRRKP